MKLPRIAHTIGDKYHTIIIEDSIELRRFICSKAYVYRGKKTKIN